MVVFPLVPVTPSTRMANDGSPWKRAASGPSTERTDATRACGTSTGHPLLDEERDRAGRDGRRRVEMPVGDLPRDATEERARTRRRGCRERPP